mmetsp:Transcript_77101/g.121757  ORF Transcript_77101/g.121757 Transcript_77101/m.121757 type:complete len:179 (-) Transcript_77101:136-672(-)
MKYPMLLPLSLCFSITCYSRHVQKTADHTSSATAELADMLLALSLHPRRAASAPAWKNARKISSPRMQYDPPGVRNGYFPPGVGWDGVVDEANDMVNVTVDNLAEVLKSKPTASKCIKEVPELLELSLKSLKITWEKFKLCYETERAALRAIDNWPVTLLSFDRNSVQSPGTFEPLQK